MRTRGTLIKWNEDRGFGFAKTRDTGIEVFTHVSEFPRGGRRPQIGDPLSFEIVSGDDGRKRARAIVFEVPATGRADLAHAPTDSSASKPRAASPPRAQRDTHARPRRPDRPRGGRRGRGVSALIATALFIGMAVLGIREAVDAMRSASVAPPPAAIAAPAASPLSTPPAARCDGRTHCSEMRSCADATWVQRNCPGAAMDGDGDGVPCETQWCR